MAMKQHVRIAHVSDLHFGVAGAKELWQSLRRYLNESLEPDLVLITGDIVDDPSKANFEAAAEAIAPLKADHLLCPGNHDRHWRGNASRFTAWLVGQHHPWFDHEFGGKIARPDSATQFTLGEAPNRWKIAIAGFDTSIQAKYSAQGIAGFVHLEQLRNTFSKMNDADLAIVLLHHHLLPIAELERFNQQVRGLLSFTTMTNAGTMLEQLAKDNVNLVLHGHEHHHSVARYGTLSGSGSDLVVLAAGSATGVETGKGAEPSRASFNLIELREDRTVWVYEIRNSDRRWSRVEADVKLFDDRQINQGRFFRQNADQLVAKSLLSQAVRFIEFHHDRDISIVDRRTNWAIEDGKWRLVTQNSSGSPMPAEIVFDWTHRGPTRFDAVAPVFHSADDHSYRFQVDGLSPQKSDLALQIRTTFRWEGGAVLTTEDLELLDPPTRGPFRRDGHEFAGFEVENDLEKLSLLVRLPPDFAPPEREIRVCIVPRGRKESDCQDDPVLTRAVQHHAPGIFSLEVNYPTTGATYVMTWKPRPAPAPTSTASAFRARARDPARASRLLRAFRDAATRLEDATFALYLPMEDGGVDLERFASHVTEGEPVPRRLSLRGALTREVWFGKTVIDDEDPSGLAVVTVPVLPEGELGRAPWALVWVRIPSTAVLSKDDLQDSSFLDSLQAGTWALLLEAVRME